MLMLSVRWRKIENEIGKFFVLVHFCPPSVVIAPTCVLVIVRVIFLVTFTVMVT